MRRLPHTALTEGNVTSGSLLHVRSIHFLLMLLSVPVVSPFGNQA